MKKYLAISVAFLLVAACFAGLTVSADFTAPDYEPANLTTDVGIMLADSTDYEGVVGIQTVATGEFDKPWRDAVLFELDEETGAYKVIKTHASADVGPGWTIEENQFVIESNTGNNWPLLFETATEADWYYASSNFQGVPYSECPNFLNDKNLTWDGVLKAIAVGSLYTLVGIDLDDPVVIANYAVDGNYDFITHNETYATYSYITPYVVPGEEPAVNLAEGKSYTTRGIYIDSSTGKPSWPDTDDKELTDGFAPTNPSHDEAGWVGFNVGATEYTEDGFGSITVDLGAVLDASGINVVVSNYLTDGIGAPTGFTFFYSEDGEDWTELGEGAYDLDPYEKDDDEAYVNKGKVVNNGVTADFSAQYVQARFTVATGFNWMFIGEIQVFGGEGEEPTLDPSDEPSTGPEPSGEPSGTDTPPTGDSGIYVLATLSVISLAGAAVIKRRKPF